MAMLPTGRVLSREILPSIDPWDAAQFLCDLPGLLLLESAERHTDRGRYSYVMAEPSEWIVPGTGISNPFDELSKRLSIGSKSIAELPPFQTGYAGLIGYEVNRSLESIPTRPEPDWPIPAFAIGRYDWVIAFDHIQHRSWIVAQSGELLEFVQRRLAGPKRLLRTTSTEARPPKQSHAIADRSGLASNFDRDGFVRAIGRAVDYIRAGDVFQVNLAQRLHAKATRHAFELYGRLRCASPAPFACYFDLGSAQIVGASPERFVRIGADGEAMARPIKGTRPRGANPAEDERLRRELLQSPKDRAENVMIVYLLRNDLGKHCRFGSISVPKVCELESYPYVHHLVSEVRGRLLPDATAIDLLRGAFPGGSITGAPKVRAMEIIAELEASDRGAYCGTMAWFGWDGAMDANIAIRTITAAHCWWQFPVGGGIVADSIPELEYAETMHKAAGMLKAIRACSG